MKTNTICAALIAAILAVFTAGTASAALDFLETKLTASDGAAGDSLGAYLAIDGDTAIVGSAGDDNWSGSAYIFRRTDATGEWTEIKKLTASDGAAMEQFGANVAIDGDTAIVGAPGRLPYGDWPGSAYIFRDTSAAGDWSSFTETKLTASDAAMHDMFGSYVAIDGDTAVVGARASDDAGDQSGSTYIFQDTSGTGDWTEIKKLTASDAAAMDIFGRNVEIDGDTIIIGAYGNSDAGYQSGSAYIFRDTSGTGDWTEIKKLTASDAAAGDHFGINVDIDGDTAIVGAYMDNDAGTNSGSAYIFRDTSGTGDWTEIKKLTASDAAAGDEFGRVAEIDGDTAIVGAWFDDDAGTDSGSAYIFKDTSTTGDWSSFSQTKLTASDAAAGDWFGFNVAIDGNTAIVGARFDDDAGTDSGSAYVYVLQSPEILIEAVIDDIAEILIDPPPEVTPEAEQALEEASFWLAGNDKGNSQNGTLDKLANGDLQAALNKIRQAINALDDASAASADTGDMQSTLAEGTRNLASAAIDEVEQALIGAGMDPNANPDFLDAQSFFQNGEALITVEQYGAAVSAFIQAVGSANQALQALP
jgi:hypothetical protein